MADILKETQEDIRREKFEKTFKKYGLYALVIGILSIAAAAGIKFYQQYTHTQAQKVGAKFYQTSFNENAAEKDLKEIVENSNSGYRDLALIKLGDREITQLNIPEAIDYYDQVINSSGDIKIKDLAQIKAIKALIITDPDNSTLQERLSKATDNNATYHYSAKELQIDYFISKKNNEKAFELTGELLKDEALPVTLRKRLTKLSNYFNRVN